MRVARVVVDIPAREIDRPFDYLIPETVGEVEVGSCVLVDFANRPAVGYVVGLGDDSAWAELKPLSAVLGGPFFRETASRTLRMDRLRVCLPALCIVEALHTSRRHSEGHAARWGGRGRLVAQAGGCRPR